MLTSTSENKSFLPQGSRRRTGDDLSLIRPTCLNETAGQREAHQGVLWFVSQPLLLAPSYRGQPWLWGHPEPFLPQGTIQLLLFRLLQPQLNQQWHIHLFSKCFFFQLPS